MKHRVEHTTAVESEVERKRGTNTRHNEFRSCPFRRGEIGVAGEERKWLPVTVATALSTSRPVAEDRFLLRR